LLQNEVASDLIALRRFRAREEEGETGRVAGKVLGMSQMQTTLQ